jgi:hypothetical protein
VSSAGPVQVAGPTLGIDDKTISYKELRKWKSSTGSMR